MWQIYWVSAPDGLFVVVKMCQYDLNILSFMAPILFMIKKILHNLSAIWLVQAEIVKSSKNLYFSMFILLLCIFKAQSELWWYFYFVGTVIGGF